MEALKKIKRQKLNNIFFFLFFIFLFNNCKSYIYTDNINEVVLYDIDKNKIMLEPDKYNEFKKDLNKLKKTNPKIFQICFDIVLINENGESTIYKTDGQYFQSNENVYYFSENNLVTEYWNINEENFCRPSIIKRKE